MKSLTFAAIGMTLAAATAVAQQAPAPAAAVETPEAFVTAAAGSNAFEIESSELALEKSEDEAVQTFAQHMIEDHTAAAEDLMAAAEADAVPPPPAALDPKHQAMVEELQQAEDADFDQLYRTMQLQAHEEAVALFTAFVEADHTGAVADFAEEKLPTLQEHLEMVETMAN